ncbi:MAG: DsbE family thiol:disulfide interchange protein [Gammaproteobacteria bacterium]|nr:DsbE family thiol:disulfide interchange protein [Gammaproteobacteria bacterium]
MAKLFYSAGKANLKFLIPLLAFAVMVALLGYGLTLNPRDLPSTLINKPAPSFTLEQLYTPGSTISPEDYLGQRWLLNVWASWCVGCRVEHPLLNDIAHKTNIPMLGLNYKDQPDQARQWLADRGNPYGKIAKDLTGNAGIDWGVYGVPETFVIDENGVVIYKHTGPLDAQVLRDEILPLFSVNGLL